MSDIDNEIIDDLARAIGKDAAVRRFEIVNALPVSDDDKTLLLTMSRTARRKWLKKKKIRVV